MANIKAQQKNLGRIARHRRVRAKISGTADRPRLSVFRSNKFISGQIINDVTGRTLVAITEQELDAKERAKILTGEGERKGKTAVAYVLGKKLAEKAKTVGIKTVVFDRGGYAFQGRIAALASGARDNGLLF